MKRILAIISAALMILTLLAGCSGKNDSKSETKNDDTSKATSNATSTPASTAKSDAKSSASPSKAAQVKFTVGFDAEFPPFGFVAKDGSYDGFDLAIAQEVCKRLGWTFVAQPINWDAKDTELESGNITCIWNGFTKSSDRVDKYKWTDAYYDNSIVAVVRADSKIKSLADLAGKTVMVQSDSSGLSALDDNKELTKTFGDLKECADYNSAFMELDQGTVDAVVADAGVANYNMKSKKGDYSIIKDPISSEVYAIGFKLGNDDMAKKVWDSVLDIAKDGTMAKIADKYVEYGLNKDSLTLIK